MTILVAEGSSGFISNDNRISMTFLSSEMDNFVRSDVFARGNIVSFSIRHFIHCIFRTHVGRTASNSCRADGTDAALGENEASNTFEWTYDGTAPEILIETRETR